MRAITIWISVPLLAIGCASSRPATTPSPVESAAPSPGPKSAPKPAADAAPVETLEPVTLYYELDSANLSEESQTNLQRLSETLRRHRELKVQLEGHTCELGTEEYNLMLGQKRAQSALQYLARLGVEPDQLSSISYGELKPTGAENTPERLARNRRTEVGTAHRR